MNTENLAQQTTNSQSDPASSPLQNSNLNQSTVKPTKKSMETEEIYSHENDKMKDFSLLLKEYRDLSKLRELTKKVPSRIANRRYAKLQELIREGEYFSEEEIQRRQPILYQMYVGRYIQTDRPAPESFHELLMNQMMNYQSEEDLDKLILNNPSLIDHISTVDKELTPQEKSDNEDELIVLMHNRFLAGLDKDFIDYDLIDNNDRYDDCKTMDRDDEERYFDQEEWEERTGKESEYTGELDY